MDHPEDNTMAVRWSLSLVGVLAVGIVVAGRAVALPDAQVVGIAVQGRNLCAGDRVPLTITVKNAGDSPLPAVLVVLTVDGSQYAEWRQPKELAPGEQAVWRTTYTGERGTHLLIATADPFDDLPEATKSNNSAFVNVGLGDKRPPFPWLAAVSGLAFFALGVAAGRALRKPYPAARKPGPTGRKGPPSGVRARGP